MISAAILLKGLVAAVIVGFVTASIKTWADRVFLVIMLVSIVGLPPREAMLINLMVLALAALLLVIRQRKALHVAAPIGTDEWLLIIISAVIGGVFGKLVSAALGQKTLLAILGIYAIAVGLRIYFVKPLAEKEIKAHIGWLAPVGLFSGFMTGLISAGGKPFAVPAYNNAMGHHPQRAYAFASLGVMSGSWTALAAQIVFVSAPDASSILLAVYEFVLVTLMALFVGRFWTEKLNKIVNLTIAPILIIVGIRFLFMALS